MDGDEIICLTYYKYQMLLLIIKFWKRLLYHVFLGLQNLNDELI